MFESLGHVIARHKKFVLSIFLLITILAGAIGSQVFNRFDSGGYSDPGSDSVKVWEYLEDTFKVKDPAVVLVVDGKDKSVDDPAVVAQAQQIESEVKNESSVESVISYWSAGGAPSLKSNDGTAAFIFVYLKSTDFTEIDRAGGYFQDKYDGPKGDVEIFA
ncbi:MAG: hypothetical protein RL590_501 [Actinomycetota bacterium]